MAYYQRKYLAFVSLVFLVVAAMLPFLRLEQFQGDLAPVLMSLVAVTVSLGAMVLVKRPAAFPVYVRLASLGFVLLVLLGGVGMWISDSFPGSGLSQPFAAGVWPGF